MAGRFVILPKKGKEPHAKGASIATMHSPCKALRPSLQKSRSTRLASLSDAWRWRWPQARPNASILETRGSSKGLDSTALGGYNAPQGMARTGSDALAAGISKPHNHPIKLGEYQSLEVVYAKEGPLQNQMDRYNPMVQDEWLAQNIFEAIGERRCTDWLWAYNNDRSTMRIDEIRPL
ncbi:MAG: hypothetical protein GY952_04310 [Rhodobacteraceae bacterium]|nr:hypothetical protein [Paracoccaceae bacterium]